MLGAACKFRNIAFIFFGSEYKRNIFESDFVCADVGETLYELTASHF